MSISINKECEQRIRKFQANTSCPVGEKMCYNHDKLFKMLIEDLPKSGNEALFKTLMTVCRFWYMGTYPTIKKEIEQQKYQEALKKIFELPNTSNPAAGKLPVLAWNKSSCAFRYIYSDRLNTYLCDAHYAIDLAVGTCGSSIYANGYVHQIEEKDFEILDFKDMSEKDRLRYFAMNGCGVTIFGQNFYMQVVHLRGRQICKGPPTSVEQCRSKEELYDKNNKILVLPMGSTGLSSGPHYHVHIIHRKAPSIYGGAVDVAELCFNMYFTLKMFDNYKEIMFKTTFDDRSKDKIVLAELVPKDI